MASLWKKNLKLWQKIFFKRNLCLKNIIGPPPNHLKFLQNYFIKFMSRSLFSRNFNEKFSLIILNLKFITWTQKTFILLWSQNEHIFSRVDSFGMVKSLKIFFLRYFSSRCNLTVAIGIGPIFHERSSWLI